MWIVGGSGVTLAGVPLNRPVLGRLDKTPPGGAQGTAPSQDNPLQETKSAA